MTIEEPSSSPAPRGSPTKLTCSLSEAAQLLGISRAAAYRAAKKGEIPTVRLGRRLLVPVPHLYRLLGVTDLGPDGESYVPGTPPISASDLQHQTPTDVKTPRAVAAA